MLLYKFIKDFGERANKILNAKQIRIHYENVMYSQYIIVCDIIICDIKINFSFYMCDEYLENIETYNECLDKKLCLMFSHIYDKLFMEDNI